MIRFSRQFTIQLRRHLVFYHRKYPALNHSVAIKSSSTLSLNIRNVWSIPTTRGGVGFLF
ncbi:hypothetical protein KCP73_05330 [Salmonella enterica subsp. enterica]|nr:hypothetical protein KCP73_05330 [Salmonella enterica subsp. enterica]